MYIILYLFNFYFIYLFAWGLPSHVQEVGEVLRARLSIPDQFFIVKTKGHDGAPRALEFQGFPSPLNDALLSPGMPSRKAFNLCVGFQVP